MAVPQRRRLRLWSGDKRPGGLKWRSSKGFIGFTACVAAFTEGFLNSAVVPVLPFSLVERSGVPEEHVQFWLAVLLVVFGGSMTIAAPIAGWITDLSSSRQAPFLASLALAFTATLLFCFGRAPWVLIAARAFQGVAGSIIYTAGLALIADSVRSDEVGSWIGFVLSGMTMGNLIAPWLAGTVYEKSGYYAVFAIILAIIAFDFILRVVMIEKRTAAKWLSKDPEQDTCHRPPSVSSRVQDYQAPNPDQTPPLCGHTPEPDETSPLLNSESKRRSHWLAETFPRMTLLLSSRRMLAATWGAFAHTMLIAYFNTTLPLFVKHLFHWGSRGAGLIFLTISAPSLLGTVFGMLSDRFGTRKVALVGFALLVPSLASLGTVTHDSTGNVVLLCLLLVLVGTGLNAILSPLAADMFHEVGVLAEKHPDVFDKGGAFAQAYSLFNGALGFSTVIGASSAGVLLDYTNWWIACGVMALLTAVIGLLVLRYTGRIVRAAENHNEATPNRA